MPVVVSSQTVNAEQAAKLTAIGSSGVLQFFDSNSNFLGQIVLPAAPGFAVAGTLVFAGFPSSFTVSSLAPVGAVPTTFSVISGGSTLISGAPVNFATTVGAVITSSQVMPGGTCGIAAVSISSGIF